MGGKIQVHMIILLLGLSSMVFVAAAPNSMEEENNNSDSTKAYRIPHFTETVYKATILNDDKISFMGSPIIMDNASDGLYFVITSDNYEDYSLYIAESNDTNQKHIELELVSTNPTTRDFDVIILEALDEDLVPVSRTTILVFNSNQKFDLYKMTFKVEDQEYIVLNFFYFKWFLGVLTITGLLILTIELYEIAKNLRKVRSFSGKYQELQNV